MCCSMFRDRFLGSWGPGMVCVGVGSIGAAGDGG